jgi:Fe2+ or Zn2+ uptake regulation protein
MKPNRIRMTRQRKAILKALKETDSHPTADQVYLMVRHQIPNVSLGTVYRNLEILCEEGAIQKLEMGRTQMRFDGRMDLHHHIRCVKCGCIGDIIIEPINLNDTMLASRTNFEITGYQLDFSGICPECKKKSPGMVN